MNSRCFLLSILMSFSAVAADIHEYPVDQTYKDSIVGGLSGLSYEASSNSYWVLSDDRGDAGGPRIYNFRFGEQNAPEFLEVIYLSDKQGQPFSAGLVDSEGLIVDSDGFWVSVEQTAKAPNITHRRFNRAGQLQQSRALELGSIKSNKGIEAFAQHEGQYLFGIEDSKEGQPEGEVSLYCDDLGDSPIEHRYQLEEFDRSRGDIGLVSLTYHPQLDSWLSLERQYIHRVGNRAKVYLIEVDCTAKNSLVKKRLLVDIAADLKISPDNLEAMAVDHEGNLVLVSDNNFSYKQRTQIIRVSLEELLNLR